MEEEVRKEALGNVNVDFAPYRKPYIKVTQNKEQASSYEIAREVVKAAIDPYLELEEKSFLNNLRVVLYGGVVTKLKPVKDYDLLITYDKAVAPDGDSQLSERANSIARKIFGSDGELNKSVGYFINVETDTDAPIPEYVDIQVKSLDTFLDELKQSPDQIKKRAFNVLLDLPSEVTSLRRFYDGFLYTAKDEEEDRRPPTTFILTLAKAFNYSLSTSELNYLAGFHKETSALHKIVDPENLSNSDEDRKEVEKRINQYLLEMSHYLGIKKDTMKSLLEGELTDKERRRLTTEMVNNFLTKLSRDVQNKVRWAYIGMLNNTNPEMGIVESGILIKGENYSIDGEPLFREDKSFLN